MLTEVIYPKEEKNIEPNVKCQVCGGDLVYGTIPCPDGKRGCLVLHYGYTCQGCGRIFN